MWAELSDESRHSLFRSKVSLYHAAFSVRVMGTDHNFQKQRRQMGLFTGKKGIVLGIANDRSIAWAITELLHREGAEIGYTHLPDMGDRPKNKNKVAKLVDPIGAKFLVPMDVCNDEHIAAVPTQ